MKNLESMVMLAWLNLVHDRRRLVVSLAGVAFAVVLMAMELGFRFALLDSMVELIRLLDTDLVIASASKTTLASSAPFNRRVLQDARALSAVAEVCPLYIETTFSVIRKADAEQSHRPQRGKTTARKIRVIAFRPRDHAFLIHDLEEKEPEFAAPDTALFDAASHSSYGKIAPGLETVLAQRPLRVVGTFRLGTDMVNDGNLIMSERNYLRYFPDRRMQRPELRAVELGLVRLAEGADAATVRRWLNEALQGQGVKVFTKDEFLAR